jgi:sugar/nucleoside kinase (ribokinase family)
MSILVVGAIHHDVIVDAPRLPRVDETLTGSAVRYAFGGKGGNQAVAAARLGKVLNIPVAIAASLGADPPGEEAFETLRQAGVSTDFVQRVETPTGMSVAISLPDGGYGAVIVSASNIELDASAISIARGTQWVVLQNELPSPVNEAVAAQAKRVGARVLLNAAPARPLAGGLADKLDLLVVNRVEAADMLDLDSETLDGKAAALQARRSVWLRHHRNAWGSRPLVDRSGHNRGYARLRRPGDLYPWGGGRLCRCVERCPLQRAIACRGCPVCLRRSGAARVFRHRSSRVHQP